MTTLSTYLTLALLITSTLCALTVDAPKCVVYSGSVSVSWSGGTGDTYISIVLGDDPTAPPVDNFGQQTSPYLWNLVTFTPGTSLAVVVNDSTGATAQSDSFTVTSGSDGSCVDSVLPVTASAMTITSESTTGFPTITSSVSSLSSTPPTAPHVPSPTGKIVGVTVGAIGAIALCTMISVYLRHRIRRSLDVETTVFPFPKHHMSPSDVEDEDHGSNSATAGTPTIWETFESRPISFPVIDLSVPLQSTPTSNKGHMPNAADADAGTPESSVALPLASASSVAPRTSALSQESQPMLDIEIPRNRESDGQMQSYDIHHLVREMSMLRARMDAAGLGVPLGSTSPPTYRSDRSDEE